MSLLEEMLGFNRRFVQEERYREFETSRFPEKKLVILTCMDTRLLELLPRALNLKHGDVKIIKNAGGIVSHPFGSIMRSILVAVYELRTEEICIIGHHDCGMAGLDSKGMLEKASKFGVSPEKLEILGYAGVDFEQWLKGFDTVEASVRNSVDLVRKHPLLPPKVPVHGLVIDPGTGKLEVIIDGYK